MRAAGWTAVVILAAIAVGILSWDNMDEDVPSWVVAIGIACGVSAVLGALALEETS